MTDFHCWRCGAALPELLLPVSRREECSRCGVDQHVCKMCAHYDAAVSGQCREERAEEVYDKESANFCDYFSPNSNAWRGANKETDPDVSRQLAALFGEDTEDNGENKNNEGADAVQSEQQAALAELEKLFNKDD